MDDGKWFRPTADVSASAILAIVLALFPMNWLLTAILGIAMIACCIDLIQRKWLANYPRVRFLASILVAMAVTSVLTPRVIAGFDGVHADLSQPVQPASSAAALAPSPVQPQTETMPPASGTEGPATTPPAKPQPAPKTKPPKTSEPAVKGDCNQLATGHDIQQQLDCSKHYEGGRQRHLTSDQSAALTRAAQGTCGKTLINVVAANSNNEAQVYAADFVNAFKAAGCNADSPQAIPGLRPTILGIFVAFRPWVATYGEIRTGNPDAYALITDLAAAGIKFDTGRAEDNFWPDSRFILVIGGDESLAATP